MSLQMPTTQLSTLTHQPPPYINIVHTLCFHAINDDDNISNYTVLLHNCICSRVTCLMQRKLQKNCIAFCYSRLRAHICKYNVTVIETHPRISSRPIGQFHQSHDVFPMMIRHFIFPRPNCLMLVVRHRKR